eukprot:CAMPEP_0171206014 /NCGR_PEP_ID=MMETSP0790-20130122/26844_1 /TAXON_ID=2925 /ORGANISM="Alexandrium catenella, Strain OF101" /LENGTH=229 /DNA_ID=CAMNT_0011671545 /DNA_START=74 /DNA_END=763 /DNA_ORIENTATION=-
MSITVVTGANRGIGLELCTQLVASGASVLAACRKTSPELQASGVQVVEGVDVTKPDSLAALASACEGKTVGVLINNAGFLTVESLDDMNFGNILKQFEVNAIGPLAVTWKLRPFLASGSKVAIVSAAFGSIAGNAGAPPLYGYKMSKAAVNMAGMQLAQDFKKDGIAVGLYHPGLVETDMTAGLGVKAGENGNVDTKAAAEGLLKHIGLLDVSSTACFINAITGDKLPW